MDPGALVRARGHGRVHPAHARTRRPRRCRGTLFLGGVGRTDLWGGDEAELLRSIRSRLWPLPDHTEVIPGHGEPTTIGEERRYNPFCAGL
jgi:hypothetical protein